MIKEVIFDSADRELAITSDKNGFYSAGWITPYSHENAALSSAAERQSTILINQYLIL